VTPWRKGHAAIPPVQCFLRTGHSIEAVGEPRIPAIDLDRRRGLLLRSRNCRKTEKRNDDESLNQQLDP
jgi:hypothetical protein